jgi:transcription elongation factor GreA
MGKIVMTLDGQTNATAELADLEEQRVSVIERMRQSLENGGGGAADNGEYVVAGAELELVERRIAVLTERLAGARLAEPKSDGEVDIGESVQVLERSTGQRLHFRIVGTGEYDPDAGDISHESPVGAALLGRRVADVVEVRVPQGVRRFEILAVHD